MSDSRPPQASAPSRAGLIIGLALAAVVALGLVWWKGSQASRARATLEKDYGAEINEFEGKRDVVLQAPGLTTLDEVIPLLQALGKVSVLGIADCPKLESLKGLGALDGLEALTANGAVSLRSLEGLAGLPKLRDVSAPECPEITSLTGLENLPSLTTLNVSGNAKLKDAGALAGLPSLNYLYISDCPELTALDVSSLSQLQQLDASGCGKLAEIVGVEKTALSDLILNTCHSLQRVPELGKAKSLASLQLRNCPVGARTAEWVGLATLGHLVLGDVPISPDLSSLAPLKGLEVLHIESAAELASLRGLDAPRLTQLSVTHCPKLTSLEGVEKLPVLDHLDVSYSAALSDLSPLKDHPALVQLTLVACKSVTDAAVVTSIKQLGILSIAGTGIPRPQVSTLRVAMPDLVIDLTSEAR